MQNLIQILPEAALLMAIVGVIQLVVLVFRNPFRPRWLTRDWAASSAGVAIATAVGFGLGAMITGGHAAGFSAGAAIGLTLAIGFGTGYAIWRGFGIRERLRRADAGQAPFYPVATPGLLGRGCRGQFGAGTGA